MADVYFQWQNEVLLKTIYPLRNMKLRDFLVYYREIELWAEYKDRSQDSLLDEINDYIKSQTQTMQEMKDSFFCLKEYFENEIEENKSTDCLKKYFGSEVDAKSTAERSPAAADEYAKIKSLHHTCKTYLPNYHNVRKEKIFIAQRVNEWEEHQKELFRRAQRVQPAAGQKNPYEDALNMAKAELDYLHQFISFYNKIDTRRVELIKPRGEKISRKETIESILNPLKLQIRNRQAQITELEDTLQRIQARPSLAVVKQHFSMGNILNQFSQLFKDQDVSFFNKFSGIWKVMNLIVTKTQGLDVMLLSIKTEIGEMKRLKEDVERRIADLEASLAKMAVDDPQRGTTESAIGKLRDLDLNGVMAELDELRDGRVALEFIVNKSDQEIAEILRGKEQELLKQQEDLASPAAQANELQKELDSIEEFLNQSSDDNLLNFISDNPLEPDHVSARDIVNARLETYSKELASKDHFGLLEEVVQRFLASPEDYPLWLQYMVIHFSGMRYASAHGSWADPKDLLINLGSSYIADDFKEEDDDWIQARCDEKIECYGDPEKALSEPGRLLPKLVQQIASEAKTPETTSNWTDKITFHLQGLKSAFTYQRRKALVDILIDEATYAVESLTPDETLATLKDVKDFLPLPEWMWREIVKLTELRTTEVTSEDWERPITLTPQEENDPDLSQYQTMMNQWKQANLTSWREAHEDTDRLIVTRAVCNEVAEHIQHLRGYRGAAGLTSKSDWYMREEKKFGKPLGEQQDDQHPYFIKPKDIANYKNDYQVGASILWLRFVNDKPNEWRIAKPLATRAGDRLVPDQYWNRKDDTNNWVYTEGDAIERHRTLLPKGNMKGSRQHQWLRWIHEATVAKVTETADGPTVLTFETALPNEDRRLSTIGVFKRQVSDLLSDMGEDGYNASFLGFVPEGKISAEDLDEFADTPEKFMENQEKFVKNLEEMLDWNHILLRQVMSDDELTAYREKYIRSKIPASPPMMPPPEEETIIQSVTDLQIKNVSDRPGPLQAWRVKWDWEGLAEYNGGVREVAPDPCVFRCGELENNQNGHYVTLTPEWQSFWFELCCKACFGRYSQNLSKGHSRWLALRWTSVGGTTTAFTNGHGLDQFRNYILDENRDADPAKIYTLVCGGATLTGTVVQNSKGTDMLKVDHFDGMKLPPPVETIDPYNDPRVFFANIITARWVKPQGGFKVIRFPQFRGKDVPIPLIANTDIYYPLNDLEKISAGIKPSPYYP